MDNEKYKTALRMLWECFGDTPIDDNDLIQEDFLHIDAYTNRFQVWHWFDDVSPDGLVALTSGDK